MDSWTFRLKGAILRGGLRLLSLTWRVREEIPDDCRAVIDGRERGLVAFWHGKMFPLWHRFRRRDCSALISASRDGELLAGYLERSLGYREVIRGSSSKGGSRALAEMVDVLSRRTLLLTPDGPRGPARQGKPGVLVAAARTGRPVIVAGWSCRRSITLSSWDSMELPYPFSKVKFRYCKFEFSPQAETKSQQMNVQPQSNLGQRGADGQEDAGEQRDADVRGNETKDDVSTWGKNDAPVKGVAAPVFWIDDDTLQRFNAALNGVSSESHLAAVVE